MKDVTKDYGKSMSDKIYKENKIGEKQQKPVESPSLPEPVSIDESENVSLSSVNEEYKYGEEVEVKDLSTGEFKEANIVKINDFSGVGERTYDVKYQTSELEKDVPASRIRVYMGQQNYQGYEPNSPPYNPTSPHQQQPIQIQINTAPQNTESPSILDVEPPKDESKNEEKEGKDTESSETKKVNISENSSDTSSSSSDSTKKITL